MSDDDVTQYNEASPAVETANYPRSALIRKRCGPNWLAKVRFAGNIG